MNIQITLHTSFIKLILLANIHYVKKNSFVYFVNLFGTLVYIDF